MNVSENRPLLLFVGCYHMNNASKDKFNLTADNILSFKRQAEIRECIEKLKLFKPTKVVLEQSIKKERSLNEKFVKFQKGEYELGKSEGEQLGFPIAAELGHKRIFGIDWNEGKIEGNEFLEFAKENQIDIYNDIITHGQKSLVDDEEMLKNSTVSEFLLTKNDPIHLAQQHQVYLRCAEVGTGEEYLGVRWLNQWYKRNLIIYANLTRIISSHDRVLVIYGWGHIKLLRQFVEDSGKYEIVNIRSYLG